MDIDVDELLSTIIEKLPAHASLADPKGGNRSWTIALKQLLANYGEEKYGLKSEFTDGTKGMSEFLLDFVWWDDTVKSRQQMALALESEWWNVPKWQGIKDYAEAVATDFYKLLVVKCNLKLMVFSSDGGEDRSLVVRRLEQDFASFAGHAAGEHYLLLDSSSGDWGVFELVVSKDGACSQTFISRSLPLPPK